jgi:hypothetical protein
VNSKVMLDVGRNDVFERLYLQKFRAMLGAYGEFVMYERDRGARDIGIHLTQRLPSGAERLTSALCWFQLKGIMESTLSADDFRNAEVVKIGLAVKHLSYWYLQPTPTYLVIFVEAVDKFFILNLQRYVHERWGASVLKLKQSRVTIEVSCKSVFDEQALALIRRENDEQQWAKALSGDSVAAKHCVRDYALIWRIGNAAKRGVEQRVEVWDWQSKMRGEIRFLERASTEEEWSTIRLHWQLMLRGEDIEATYPYLEFYCLNDVDSDELEDIWFDNDVPSITLSTGEEVPGQDAAGEYHWYMMGVRLNELGTRLLESVLQLRDIGFFDINEDCSEFLSVAPWHNRSI